MRNYVNNYGLGDEAEQNPPVSYPLRFNYFRFTEKAYKNMGNNFYAGGGISIDMRNDIQDENLDSVTKTPHYNYSIAKGFDSDKYFVNGLIANVQYNTKEHPNRPFKGIYAEAYVRYNTKLLGSTKESGQLYTEFRKYWSLSSKNPEHVFAFGIGAVIFCGAHCLILNCPLQHTIHTTAAVVLYFRQVQGS